MEGQLVLIMSALLVAMVGGVLLFLKLFTRTVPAVHDPKRDAEMRSAALNAAYRQYQSALEALKSQPTSADLRQEALRAGRAYAALTRSSRAATVYDELAVSNDIAAACAGAGASGHDSAASHATRLGRLNELRDKGVITDEEHRAKRQELLGRL